VEKDGQRMFLIDDPEGICRDAVLLSPGAMLLAALFNGELGASELRALFAEKGGDLDEGELVKLAETLRKAGLLETEELAAQRRRILDDFLASPVRRALHAGGGYPKDTVELAKYLGGFCMDPKGPGKALAEPVQTEAPLGLVSPHIDFERGGPTYAWGYQTLPEAPAPDLIVALGVAHASPDSPWAATRKDYETPHGPMRVDPELFDAFKDCLWYDPLDDEWVHRREHSLEFQAVWLKSLWKDKAPPWLPILCSSFERFCPDRAPSSVESVEGAVRRFGESLKARSESGRRVMVLAGVDMAHVGPCFGDDIVLDEPLFARVEDADRASLKCAQGLDADAFYLSVVKGGDWRKVCGLSAMYTALRWMKALGAGEGRLLSYGQAPDPSGGVVSFASLVYR
jgi:AmmeMemoRadiSam system protein B